MTLGLSAWYNVTTTTTISQALFASMTIASILQYWKRYLNFNKIFKIILNILIIAYFQPSVGLIISETTLSLNSKQDDIIEINWILIK